MRHASRVRSATLAAEQLVAERGGTARQPLLRATQSLGKFLAKLGSGAAGLPRSARRTLRDQARGLLRDVKRLRRSL